MICYWKHRAWLLIGMWALAACIPHPRVAAQTPPSDDAVRQAIQKRFAASKIGANGFQVEVKNGIATLRGETDVAQHKGVATRLAKLAGAREVDNQIMISEKGRSLMRESLRKREPAKAKQKEQTEAAFTPEESQKAEAAAAGTSSDKGGKGEPGENAHPVAEPTQPKASAAVPRFTVEPKAKRGDTRSQKRRY